MATSFAVSTARRIPRSESTDARSRLAYLKKDRSMLDSVTDELSRFQKGIGSVDRAKVDQFGRNSGFGKPRKRHLAAHDLP